VVLNDKPHVLEVLCDWFGQQEYTCVWASVAEMRQPHIEVDWFVRTHTPDVVIYDVGPPYVTSWASSVSYVHGHRSNGKPL
jgi:DNA-binding response OmpR family regulator